MKLMPRLACMTFAILLLCSSGSPGGQDSASEKWARQSQKVWQNLREEVSSLGDTVFEWAAGVYDMTASVNQLLLGAVSQPEQDSEPPQEKSRGEGASGIGVQEQPKEQPQEKPYPDELLQLMQQLALAGQEKQQLSQKMRQLESENAHLRQQIQNLVRETLELRQALKELRSRIPASGPGDSSPGSGMQEKAPNEQYPKPDRTIKGAVLAKSDDKNDNKFKFIYLDVGMVHGVKEGYRFKVMNEGKIVAVVQIVKLLDMAYSKAEIVSGYKFEDINTLNQAESISSESDTAAPSPVQVQKEAAPEQVKKPETETSNPFANHKVAAIIGNKYVLSIGTKDKAKAGERVGVVRDLKVVAELVIEQVDHETCTARLADGSTAQQIREGDDLVLRPGSVTPVAASSKITGTIKSIRQHVDKKQLVVVVVNIGYRQGVSDGQTFTVKRDNEMVGKVIVTSVFSDFSHAAPSHETRPDDLREGDRIESQ